MARRLGDQRRRSSRVCGLYGIRTKSIPLFSTETNPRQRTRLPRPAERRTRLQLLHVRRNILPRREAIPCEARSVIRGEGRPGGGSNAPVKAISGRTRRSSEPGWMLWTSTWLSTVCPPPCERGEPSSPCYQLIGLLLVLRLLLEHRVELDASHAQSRSLHIVQQAAEQRERAK